MKYLLVLLFLVFSTASASAASVSCSAFNQYKKQYGMAKITEYAKKMGYTAAQVRSFARHCLRK